MHYRTTWVLAAASAGLYFACGSQPDWTDVETELALRKAEGNAGGSDMTGGPSTTGSSGDMSSVTTGASGSEQTTSGASGSGNPGTGGSPVGGAGTMMSTMDSGAGTPDAPVSMDKRAQDLVELADALKNLNGFLYTNGCKIDCGGKDVTTLAGCGTGDICWDTAGCGRFSEFRNIAIGGPAGHVYEVDLNILGVTEPRDYPANCVFEPMQPQSTTSVTKCADGFANQGAVTFNVYELAILQPAVKYYLNAVQTHPPHRVDKTDNKWTVTINAAQTLKFTFDDLNGGEIRNCTTSAPQSVRKTAAKSPFGDAVPIVANPMVSQPFNGNWFQLNVIDARVK